MNKPMILAGGLLMGVLVAAGGMVLSGERGERGEYGEHERGEGGGRDLWRRLRGPDVEPVSNALYGEECGSCHMAYPPGLLPTASWAAIMNGLSDHFGDSAALDDATRQEISDYLAMHAADRADSQRSQAFAASVRGEAPLRISETRYFLRKHDEIPARAVKENPEVGSFANCGACHSGAEQGDFNEHGVRIPGYGRWED